MPKKVFTLNDFSGGLVTDKSDRALEDNDWHECYKGYNDKVI